MLWEGFSGLTIRIYEQHKGGYSICKAFQSPPQIGCIDYKSLLYRAARSGAGAYCGMFWHWSTPAQSHHAASSSEKKDPPVSSVENWKMVWFWIRIAKRKKKERRKKKCSPQIYFCAYVSSSETIVSVTLPRGFPVQVVTAGCVLLSFDLETFVISQQ